MVAYGGVSYADFLDMGDSDVSGEIGAPGLGRNDQRDVADFRNYRIVTIAPGAARIRPDGSRQWIGMALDRLQSGDARELNGTAMLGSIR